MSRLHTTATVVALFFGLAFVLACQGVGFRAEPGEVTGGDPFRLVIPEDVLVASPGSWVVTSLDPDVVPLLETTVTPSGPGDVVLAGLPTRAVSRDTTATLRLSNGGAEIDAALVVQAPRVDFVQLPESLASGESATGTVGLNGPAPSSGLKVHLVPLQDTIVVPQVLVVRPGEASLAFPVSARGVASDESVQLVAAIVEPNSHAAATTTVEPPALLGTSFAGAPVGGQPAPGLLELSGPAPPGGAVVALTPLDALGAVDAAEVFVPEGHHEAAFELATHPVASDVLVNLQASWLGQQSVSELSVRAARLGHLSFSPQSVRGGRSVEGEVALFGVAGPGGVEVSLSTSSPHLGVPPTVVVAEGEQVALFTAQVGSPGSTDLAVATATTGAPGTPGYSTADGDLLIQPQVTGRVLQDPSVVSEIDVLPPLVEGGASRQVAAATDASGIPMHFVAGEVLLRTGEDGILASFLETYGGALVTTIDPADYELEGTPTHVIAMDAATLATYDAALLEAHMTTLQPEVLGELRFGSDPAELGLFALVADAIVAGYDVHVSLVGQSRAIADGSTQEAPTGFSLGGDPWSPDAFTQKNFLDNFSPGHSVTTAWGYMQRTGRDANRVTVGVVDGGFMMNDPDMPADQMARTVLAGAALGVSNPNNCGTPCPWHGSNVSQMLAAGIDDGMGIAGVGGQVTRPVTIQSTLDTVTVRLALLQAVADGARAVNLSYGGRVPAASTSFVDMLEDDTAFLHSIGVMVLAAAGNDGQNVDAKDTFGGFVWEEAWWFPCENPGVTCVGGLGYGSTWHDSSSNYGAHDVDLYAPYNVHVGASPSTDPSGATARATTGTSFSTPFAAGVLAMVMAADPGLSGPAAMHEVITGGWTSYDYYVDRLVNAGRSVRKALGDAPPEVEITLPVDGGTVDGFTSNEFNATAADFEDANLTIFWSSSQDGALGTGQIAFFPNLSPGLHTITATVTDSNGWTVSDSITVTKYNDPPVMTMLEPYDGQIYYDSIPIELRGESFDLDTFASLPNNQVWWSSDIDGGLGGGHQITATLSPGTHNVTLYGMDPGNAVGSTTRQVVVQATGPDLPPSISISTPTDGASYPAHSTVGLLAFANDPEDGNITGNIVWSSDIDGVYGTGGLLYVNPSSSNCGIREHDIRASITDSDGKTVWEEVRVRMTANGPC